ncbi:hypothetical protein HHK36_015609 [Tetracentron sinense]|uniref:Uncharacterized protein n=1 Tax=Tetracentron sinense TaxID=13715 RepID=A0A835DCZ4_TETSI|nr:hypothetical protein HHK36_015609 [Tetracentron sinense]
MATTIGSSFSSVATYFSSPSHPKRSSKPRLSRRLFDSQRCNVQQLSNAKGKAWQFLNGTLKIKGKFPKRQFILFASSEDHQSSYSELKSDASEQEKQHHNAEDVFPGSSSCLDFERTDGKPGFVSFYRRPYERQDHILVSSPTKDQMNLLWFIGPAVLVASFIVPSLYMRRILSTVFEDSLLTEALFYCGVAVFLLLVDHLQRPLKPVFSAKGNRHQTTKLGHRIYSVAALVLSLIIPMVTMGFVWPWTGPAASATLAPFLVGIVVQFTFEQYARYLKSPSWPLIPVIFQVYRLHQLNRAAQLVTALSFTVRGAETTLHNLAINSSLGTLLNVLQFLGVICIWSLSSFVMGIFPSAAMTEQ